MGGVDCFSTSSALQEGRFGLPSPVPQKTLFRSMGGTSSMDTKHAHCTSKDERLSKKLLTCALWTFKGLMSTSVFIQICAECRVTPNIDLKKWSLYVYAGLASTLPTLPGCAASKVPIILVAAWHKEPRARGQWNGYEEE